MKNLDSALSRLSLLPEKIRRAAARAALEAARDTALAARNAAPVRTGALRASVSVYPRASGAEVHSSRPYAGFVENGTSRMPARPYLLPAARGSDYFRRAARACQEELK